MRQALLTLILSVLIHCCISQNIYTQENEVKSYESLQSQNFINRLLLPPFKAGYFEYNWAADTFLIESHIYSLEQAKPVKWIQAYQDFLKRYRKANFKTVVEKLNYTIDYYRNVNEQPLWLYYNLCLIKLYELNGEFDSIISQYHKTITQFDTKEAGFRDLMSALNNSMGRSYYQMAQFDSSLYYYKLSLSFSNPTDTQNYVEAFLAGSGLGMIHSRLFLHEKALYHYRQTYNLAVQYANWDRQIAALSNIGVAYYEMGDYKNARLYFIKALAEEKNNNKHNLRQLYGMMAKTIIMDSPDSLSAALRFAQMSYDESLKSGIYEDIIQSAYTLGVVYEKMKQYSRAKKYILIGLQLAEKKRKIENITLAYDNLSEIYQSLGNYKEALNYQKKYFHLRDSFQGIGAREKFTFIEQQYQNAEKEKQLTQQAMMLQLQESNLREKNFWIISIGFAAMLITILFSVLYRNSKIKQKASLLQLQQQKEIEILKNRMEAEQEERTRIGRELHDGIASQMLSIKLNINAIKENDGKQINEYALAQATQQLEEATQDIRSTAHSLLPEVLIQQGLIQAVAILCEKTERYGNIETDLQVYGAIPQLGAHATLSLYRIIQELIQNVIKHANASALLIQFNHTSHTLCITIEDNGIGISPKNTSEMTTFTGIGLKTVRYRVEELHGSIDINSSPGETNVYMEFDEKWLI